MAWLRLLLLLPVLLLQQVLLRLCRRNLSHCHYAAGEGGRVVVLRPLRGAASRVFGDGWSDLGPTFRTLPAGRLMLPAALLRLVAAQHCGFFLGP